VSQGVGTKLKDWKGPWPVLACYRGVHPYVELCDGSTVLASTDMGLEASLLGTDLRSVWDSWHVVDYFEDCSLQIEQPSTMNSSIEPSCRCSSPQVHGEECEWMRWRKS
jgi:hypothetical protein